MAQGNRQNAFVGVKDGKVFGVCLSSSEAKEWLDEGASSVECVPIEVARRSLFQDWPLGVDTLRAENKRLRDALREARQFIEFHEADEDCVFDAGISARAALSEASS